MTDPMVNVNTEQIRKAQNGDEAMISALYQRYHQSVFRYLYFRLADQQTAEDLTSEVFVRMLRFLGGFQPPSASFQAWLFQIARNLVTDHFRRMGIREDIELEEDMIAVHDDPADAVERGLTSETLRRALKKLNDDQRDVIILRFVAGMPLGEVAESLNKSEDAIKGLQRRALIALRQILADWEVAYVQ